MEGEYMLVLYMSFIDDEIHRRLFEEVYITYRKQMFLVARAVLSNDSDAEDAVHDVFLKIAKSQMQKIGSIQEAADVRNYLLRQLSIRLSIICASSSVSGLS